MRPATFIALLRGVNVGGRNQVAMAELRAACAELGWDNVQTYIQSGNIVFWAKGNASVLENVLEAEIARRFGISIPVIVRRADKWTELLQGNPFPEELRREANLVMLAVSRKPPNRSAVEELRARAASGERIERRGDALWIYFGCGVAKSKLSPGLLDRYVGSPVTTRNWRTVVKLDELARAGP